MQILLQQQTKLAFNSPKLQIYPAMDSNFNNEIKKRERVKINDISNGTISKPFNIIFISNRVKVHNNDIRYYFSASLRNIFQIN